MDMLRILIVANYISSTGGISGQVELLCKCLNKEGIEADIYSTKGGMISRLGMFHDLYCEAKAYDVIHVHCCSYIGFFPAVLAIKVAKRLGKRIICTYHGGSAESFFKRFSWLVKYYLKQTNENIVLSGFLAGIFDKYGLMYRIIPNMLSVNESHYRERHEIQPNFISVRTLQPLYNIECIIKAFTIVKQSMPEAKLCILGDGPCRKNLEQLVLDLKLEDVYFEGRVPNSKVYDYLDQSDIFISMPKIDNQPMSILEASECGLLVISSNVGGVPYMLEDNVTGLLVESDNFRQLAEKMIWAIEHGDKSLGIIKTAKKSLSNYSWDNIKGQLYSCYGIN